ncbi:MAG TPA: TetR/AcrR family transcriptional regulator [Phototrophicaceae bacterium]|nr:TetR/AcrR family transcriptional regulator [Phototrophicaceae bacterium]
MTQDISRRERRIAERKQQILEAAAQVFAEKGYHRATTKDIAEAADVAEGTIYNYFASKDDLIIAILGGLARLNVQQTMLDAALDQDLGEFVRYYVTERMRLIAPYQKLVFGVLPEILHHEELRERYSHEFVLPALHMIEAHIQQRVERGQLRDVDVPTLTRIFMSILFGLQIIVIAGDPVSEALWENPEQLAAALADMVLKGVGQ